ncbi:MAG: hypothetical protein PUP92_07365 [Rhizonema sp. PD38]|nr:hypothetical protein [Rhizonema sp. PD38]
MKLWGREICRREYSQGASFAEASDPKTSREVCRMEDSGRIASRLGLRSHDLTPEVPTQW